MTTYTIQCDCTNCNGKTRELPDTPQTRQLTTGNSKTAKTARHNLVGIGGLRSRLSGKA